MKNEKWKMKNEDTAKLFAIHYSLFAVKAIRYYLFAIR